MYRELNRENNAKTITCQWKTFLASPKTLQGIEFHGKRNFFMAEILTFSHDKTKLDSMFRNVEFNYQCIA